MVPEIERGANKEKAKHELTFRTSSAVSLSMGVIKSAKLMTCPVSPAWTIKSSKWVSPLSYSIHHWAVIRTLETNLFLVCKGHLIYKISCKAQKTHPEKLLCWWLCIKNTGPETEASEIFQSSPQGPKVTPSPILVRVLVTWERLELSRCKQDGQRSPRNNKFFVKYYNFWTCLLSHLGRYKL